MLPDPTEVVGSEMAKSQLTRRRILDAAVEILAGQGHAGFSTIAVADRAGITRPAMLYHFPGREHLLTATVYHLMRRRAEAFEAMLKRIAALPLSEQQEGVRIAFETLGGYDSEEYAAFAALAMQARGDEAFAEVLGKAAANYERARLLTTYHYMAGHSHMFRKLDVLTTLADGLMAPIRMVENHAAREAAVRRFLGFLATSPEGEALFDAAEKAGALLPEDQPL